MLRLVKNYMPGCNPHWKQIFVRISFNAMENSSPVYKSTVLTFEKKLNVLMDFRKENIACLDIDRQDEHIWIIALSQ